MRFPSRHSRAGLFVALFAVTISATLLGQTTEPPADAPAAVRGPEPGVAGKLAVDAESTRRFRSARFLTPGSQPSGLAYDGASLFVSELSGFRTIHELDPSTGEVRSSFLAPSPTGLDGRGNPNGLVHDGTGSLFVADIGDFGAGVVYETDVRGTVILHRFAIPFRGGGIAFDGRDLYIADFDSGEILVTDRFGNPIRSFDSGLRPAGLTFDTSSGTLWVIGQFDDRIAEITADGERVRSCAGPRRPGIQGLGGITRVEGELYLTEVLDPDPFAPPAVPGVVFAVVPAALRCEDS